MSSSLAPTVVAAVGAPEPTFPHSTVGSVQRRIGATTSVFKTSVAGDLTSLRTLATTKDYLRFFTSVRVTHVQLQAVVQADRSNVAIIGIYPESGPALTTDKLGQLPGLVHIPSNKQTWVSQIIDIDPASYPGLEWDMGLAGAHRLPFPAVLIGHAGAVASTTTAVDLAQVVITLTVECSGIAYYTPA